MQRLIEQVYSTDEDVYCDRCGHESNTFATLSCDHKYCVICLTFMYVKHRKLDPNEGTVKCIRCEAITNLLPSHLQIVTKTLKQQVIPSIESQNQLTIPKNTYGLQYTQTINRKIKSQQHSFQHNVTPSTAKCFFSKCESPSSRKKQSSKLNCRIHRNQLITHICFTCDMQPLCIKCFSSTKKHVNHEVVDIQKGISSIVDQVSHAKFQLCEKIQDVQVWEHRLEDRNVMIKNRATQILSDVRGCFQNMFAKLQQKQEQIIVACQKNFQQVLERNSNQIMKIGSSLQIMRAYFQKIVKIQKDSENFDFITKWAQIKNQIKLITQNSPDIQFEMKVKLPSNTIFREINHILNELSKLCVSFKNSNLSRVGTAQIQNCRSESKLKKQQKRLKTNFVSLNSSRQKKKKNTKTEEDERRLRTQKMNLEIDKRNSKMPAYITDFISKKGQKINQDGYSYALQATSPNIQSSKLTAKLSKTISPQQINRKKKDNMALIKQRMERKTAQPSCKPRTDGSKKKKIH